MITLSASCVLHFRFKTKFMEEIAGKAIREGNLIQYPEFTFLRERME